MPGILNSLEVTLAGMDSSPWGFSWSSPEKLSERNQKQLVEEKVLPVS